MEIYLFNSREKDTSNEDLLSLATKNSSITFKNNPLDLSTQMNIKIEGIYNESINNLKYDLLPKPIDGIPIPHFPSHISAFLNGTSHINQLNALVQVLYQEIVKYNL